MAQIKNFWNRERLRRLTDIRSVGLYIFTAIAVTISWSGVKTVQKNYELQKQISVLKQQNDVLRLTNENTQLQNEYLETDQYLELSARQNFGLAAPGETVLLVPKSVSMKYVDPALTPQPDDSLTSPDTRSKYVKNFDAWRDFLMGRSPSEFE